MYWNLLYLYIPRRSPLTLIPQPADGKRTTGDYIHASFYPQYTFSTNEIMDHHDCSLIV